MLSINDGQVIKILANVHIAVCLNPNFGENNECPDLPAAYKHSVMSCAFAPILGLHQSVISEHPSDVR